MERNLLSWLTGQDYEMITAKEWLGILKIPAVAIWLLTLPIGISANFVEESIGFTIVISLTALFGLMALFVKEVRNKRLSIFFFCLGFITFVIFAVIRAAEYSGMTD